MSALTAGRGVGGRGSGSLVSPFALRELSPYAWFDAHVSGGSDGMLDISGNDLGFATNGAGSNAALFLPYTVPSAHLEAATAGTNSITCTAPSGTASYSAVPRGGGAPTTGAQSPGAFTFSTAGDWQSIQLLTAGSAEVARFDASACTQTGHTDAYGVVWTVNHGTAGRKMVVQSPAANSVESLFLFGVDDYMTVPAASLPPMGKTAGNFTALFVYRMWPTPGSWNAVWGRRQSGGGLHGFYNHNVSTTNTTSFYAYDGTLERSVGGVAWTDGIRNVASFRYDVATTTMGLSINGGTEATASLAAAGAFDISATDLLIGAHPAGYYNDMEFRGCIFFDRVITAAERTVIKTYYGGGL